ncbi:GNAT family N-acetyltransferase [Streptomyces sp. KR80]|uniref:GNAT family N-acetyltransferase n=1 Tax=Streptomyces sp. KR80 TaxID=3457426 RepID=UPI003FD682B0
MLQIREMAEADIAAVAAVRVRGWQYAYAGLIPRPYLNGLSVAEDAALRRERFTDRQDRVDNLVAERKDKVVGWACTGPCRDEDADPGDGELYALYVLPEHLSTGVGRALLEESLARATDRGFPRLRLWVLKGNARARRFYEIAGFEPDGTEVPYEVGGAVVPEVRYVRPLGAGPR